MDGRKRDAIGSAPTTPGKVGPGKSTLLVDPHATDAQASDTTGTTGDPLPGSTIGRFVVRERIGSGGMGAVFAGSEKDLGRPVAIKLLHPSYEHPTFRARMLREAQAMARLEHPNVVRVYEVGTDHGRLFVAMEYIDGVTLGAWLKEHRSWRTIVAMFVEIGNGLAAVHRAGLIHRDFKPDNVLVDQKDRPHVADFGLARFDVVDDAPLTRTGAIMGTPGYMAPEQQAAGNVDARADQYSYCVALREALGGRPLDDLRWQLVPAEIRAVVTRGLAYDASERFPSLDELVAALLRASGPTRRRSWFVVAGALAIAAAATGVVAYAASRAPSGPSRETTIRVATPPPPQVPSIDRDAAMSVVADAAIATPHVVDDAAVVVNHGHDKRSTEVEPQPAPPHLKPEARVGAPGHLAVVRAAIRDLGYGGVDLDAIDRDPEATRRAFQAELDGATGMAAGIAKIKLAMLERRVGNCKQTKALVRASGLRLDGPEPAPLWTGRGAFAFALCDLADDNARDANDVIMTAWDHGEHDEVQVATGMIQYELGDMRYADATLTRISHTKDPRARAALLRWLDGFGIPPP